MPKNIITFNWWLNVLYESVPLHASATVSKFLELLFGTQLFACTSIYLPSAISFVQLHWSLVRNHLANRILSVWWGYISHHASQHTCISFAWIYLQLDKESWVRVGLSISIICIFSFGLEPLCFVLPTTNAPSSLKEVRSNINNKF